jgi:small subunit ribosomal protein S4e
VKHHEVGPKKVPYLTTHDGRTIRYPDPLIHPNDTVQVDIATGKITDHIRFESGKKNLLFPSTALFTSFRSQATWS